MARRVTRIPLITPVVHAARSWYQGIRGPARLRRMLASAAQVRLVIGASGVYEPGWIPGDIEFLNLLRRSDWQRFFAPGSIDAIMAEHVWEHLTEEEGRQAAQTCFEFLKPGGYLRVAVPDGGHPDPEYQRWVAPHGLGRTPDHKVLYTADSFADVFEAAGFQVTLLEYFDSSGRFQYQEWDPALGTIRRSRRFDQRNEGGVLRYTSVILDAVKPVVN